MRRNTSTYHLPPTTYSNRGGFTLIELLVFAAIFSGMMIAFISVLVTITSIQARQASVFEVNQQSQFLLQQIQQLTERSSLIELPQDIATTTLKLRMPSPSEDPTYITVSNGIVYLQQGSGPQNPLTSNKVAVSSLAFTKRSNPPGHDSVAVSFLIAYNTLSVKQQFSETLNTAIARVSAATFDSNVIPSSTATFDLGVTSNIWRSINNTIYFSGGNVGIGSGASTPGSQLDLAGAQTFRGMSAPATSSAGQAVLYYDTSANQLKLSQNAGAYANLGSSGPWNTSGTAIYYNSGNVGIGTTATEQVHLYGSRPVILLDSTAANADAIVGRTAGATLDWVLGHIGYGGASNANMNVWTNSNLPIAFGTNDVERMRIVTSGNVGIGTAGPATVLHIEKNYPTIYAGDTSDNLAAHFLEISNTNTATGVAAGLELRTGGGGVARIAAKNMNGASAADLLFMTRSGAADVVERMRITSGGNVGIGTTGPTYQLQLSTDSAGKPNGGSWSNSSDARLKTDVAPILGSLDRLTKLNPVSFIWRNPGLHGGFAQSAGFLAQDVMREFPGWITKIDAVGADKALVGTDGKAYSLTLPFEYDALVVGAIKELQAENKALKEKNEELEIRVKALELIDRK